MTSSLETQPLPTAADVHAAAARLKGSAVVTPLLRNAVLDEIAGATVLLKAEVFQRTGSFKFRGAYNRLVQLSPAERRAGVVAWSSGNHAQGVAAAAKLLNVPAAIVMPSDAPLVKTEGTRRLGAEIVPYDRTGEDREQIARALAAQRGAVIVPSYDDPHIIAGQGTVGLEMIDQARAMGMVIDDVLVPASGGGLTAGIALATSEQQPRPRIFTTEPAGYDDHRRSLKTGTRAVNSAMGPAMGPALCDALLAPTPGTLTWRINANALSGGYAVSDADVRAAMAFAFQTLKLVVEPGGAVALAALLAGHHRNAGGVIAVVLSGGNVDPQVFVDAIR